MKGSYRVPIGSSRTPLMECDRPSAERLMNRFDSAMPSSMCWPFGENSQLKVEGICSLLKVSAIASRANRPRRLTQGPRLVETVTSGEVVTMRCANSIVAAADLVEDGPEAGLRRHHRLDGDFQRVRHRNSRRGQTALAAGSERHLVEECLQGVGVVEAFELVPFVAGTHRHLGAEASPSAPASSGRRGCPCARPSAARSPSPCSR